MNISKELKKKRDAEARLNKQSPTPTFSSDGTTETYIDISGLATKSELTAGLADKSDIGHAHAITELTDVSIAYSTNAGKFLKVNSTEDGIDLGEATGGGADGFLDLTDTPAAYTGEGGKIVAVKSTADGLEFVSAPAAANGIPTSGTAGQILSKIDGTDYNVEWIDAPSGGSSWPDYMEQDEDGLKIYDSLAKTNLKATVGRELDPTQTIETNHIPDMISNSAPSGTASASTEFSGYPAWNAMDRSTSTFWSTESGIQTGWISYEFTVTKTINKYTITGRDSASDGSPKDWTFEGWDGTQWVILDTQAGITWSNGEKKSFTFTNTTSYIKYRVNVSANNGRSTLNIGELEFIESQGAYTYGLITTQYMKALSGSALPTAEEFYRGQIFVLLGGAGVADIPYLCIKNSSDVYAWITI